jgi:hypothetical protein
MNIGGIAEGFAFQLVTQAEHLRFQSGISNQLVVVAA